MVIFVGGFFIGVGVGIVGFKGGVEMFVDICWGGCKGGFLEFFIVFFVGGVDVIVIFEGLIFMFGVCVDGGGLYFFRCFWFF